MPDQAPLKPRVKSEETRARILAAAIELFRSEGFEAATMRQIAAAAGVATGAAYYYFDSKESIVLAFYDQTQQDLAPRMEQILAASRDLQERVHGIISAKLKYFESSRALLGALAAHADPDHPISPFSAHTQHIRDSDMQFFARALEGSRVRIADDLKGALPRLLWVYQMGVVLFWIYDRSPAQKKTRALLDQSLRIVVTLIKLSGLPLMRPVRRLVLDLLDTVTA
jgi:AcrR family transcriptional regulator